MILVADRDHESRALLVAALTDAAHSVLEASDGDQAWDLLCQHAPPIVILDWMAPGNDSLELCRRIRRHPEHAAAYVIVLAPTCNPQDVAVALDAGADDCLTRQFTADDLHVRVMVARRAVEARAESRKAIDRQLRRAEKLEGIGQLAAGIAHEINTPMQYIGDNVRFLGDSVAALDPLLTLLIDLAEGRCAETTTAEIGARAGAADLHFLRTHMTRAAVESLEGVEHVSGIVRAMREFSHPGSGTREPLDINRAIETILVLARNELKYVADVHLELDPALPLVPCLAGEIRQALLNLVINAAHAVGDAVAARSGSRGEITVTTRVVGGEVEIRIDDTGVGIPKANRTRVFEPFFTTKEPGRGTGQGLALAHATIVGRHGGRLWFESVPGRGTTFYVRLPLPGA